MTDLFKRVDSLTSEQERLENHVKSRNDKIIALTDIIFNERELSKLLELTNKGHKLTIIRHKHIENEYKQALESNYIAVTMFFVANCILEFMGFSDPSMFFHVMGITMVAISAMLIKVIGKKANKVSVDSEYMDKEKKYQELRKTQNSITATIDNM